jgi:hypothetical protein
MAGWIKLHRKMLEWEWYDDINVCRLWTHLLLKANHKDNRWKGVDVKAGQLITGRLSLSDETGLTEQQIRTALKKLKSTGEITSKIYSKFSVITITSWPSYQTDNQQETQQATSKQPASNHKQECKELENDKNKEITSSSTKADPIPYQQIVDSYNDNLPMLRRCIKVTDKVRNTIRKSWNADKRHQDIQFWDRYFIAIPRLPNRLEFWTGVDGGNKQGIDLIARKDIFERTVEELVNLQR